MTTPQKILVLGGGAIGLASAIELARQGAEVTILNHRPQEAALFAAAGMLAPEAEKIDNPKFFEFCRESRDRYPEWVGQIEQLSGTKSGYWPCGIVAPQYQAASTINPEVSSKWLTYQDLQSLVPDLSPEVEGGWFYAKDGQINNRQLGHSLNLAALKIGVTIHNDITINSLVIENDRITKVKTQKGDWDADHYLLATGAWTGMMEDIPVVPRKGQMLSVTPMDGSTPLALKHVLFGEEIYIVPRQTGEIIIGATSEDVGFTPGNTVAGIQKLLNAATRLVPQLKNYELFQQWWGYRPTTPDELPILGASPWKNLSIASGHYRNGILLIPLTAHLLAQHILSNKVSPDLSMFRWDRFKAKQHQQEPESIFC